MKTEPEVTVSSSRRRRRPFGIGLLSLGLVSLGFGAVAGGAHAWEGSCYDYAPTPGAWTEFRVELPDADLARLTGEGQSFTDGSLTVVLSGATAADESTPLTLTNVGSVDFTANPGVAAVYVRTDVTTDNVYIYDDAVTAGFALSGTDRTTPIEWLTFCYVPGLPSATSTSTSTTTTTTTTTTTMPPTSSTAPELVVEVTTTVPTEVLGEQIERVPPELARTGTNSSRLLFLGTTLMFAGFVMMVADRRTIRRQSN